MRSRVDGWERRRFYGFVEGIVPALERPYSRISLVLDCVDANRLDEGPDAIRDPEALFILRLLTTPRALTNTFRLPSIPKEGDWVHIELQEYLPGPRVWVLEARNAYDGIPIETRLASIAYISNPDDALESQRARRLSQQQTRYSRGELATFCQVKSEQNPDESESRLSLMMCHPGGVRVVDVGQASCNTLHLSRQADSPIVAFFDVGAPLFFNRKSFCDPAKFKKMNIEENASVILSHWDFDHYALALKELQQLKGRRWFAPEQAVGPNTAAFQRSLGDRLSYLQSPSIGLSGSPILYRGLGQTQDRNGSGYVMRIDDPHNPILLTGDVPYDLIQPLALQGVTRLTVPHHGGASPASPPFGPGRAVASYGQPNKYRHPCSKVMTMHQTQRWLIETTAWNQNKQRGDRWL